jgi:glyoxylase-like metal-dependent hydrolase (beta-lactamase superfamily II)
MIHEMLPVGLLQCNCSIFGDEQTHEAIVVDPGDELPRIQAILDKHGLQVKAIVITHGHIDHVIAASELRRSTGAPVYMNQKDSPILDQLDAMAEWLGMETPEQPEIDTDATDGSTLALGTAEFIVLHTPGHTPGSSSLWIPQEEKLVAGDTLFRDSIGRTDLPGGDHRLILSSIRTRLLELPDDALVIPGHGPTTTIGRERERNPFLRGL